MLSKNSNLTESVKPFAKDQASQEKILAVMNNLRPTEECVYRTFPAVLTAEQKLKGSLEKAGVFLGDNEICALCNTLDDVYIKGIAHGVSLTIIGEPDGQAADK